MKSGHRIHQRLIESASDLPAARTAVVCPCDPASLQAALDAASRGLIEPVLIGPEQHIRSMATRHELDIADLPVIDAQGAFAAVAHAAELAQHDEIDAVMNGSLHICELLAVVVGQPGGMQPDGWISHCLVIDIPSARDPLVIMTSASNAGPGPEEKAGIMQNATDLAGTMRAPELRIAVLSTMETVNAKVSHTAFVGALPRSENCAEVADVFDRAGWNPGHVESAGARKRIAWPEALRADVLVAADLNAADLLVRSLSLLAEAHAAEIVMGACVPIIVASRTGFPRADRAACAVASLLADVRRRTGKSVTGPSMQLETMKTVCGTHDAPVPRKIELHARQALELDLDQCIFRARENCLARKRLSGCTRSVHPAVMRERAV